jgi:hemerythrin-like metal-binding protein
MLIEAFEQRYVLGNPGMDQTHREFVDLVNLLESADRAAFVDGYAHLLAHTEAHFEAERTLMQKTGFPAQREHTDEHQRVVGELRRIGRKVASGSLTLARAYVREQLPAWFDLHAVTMDSALAAHIRQSSVAVRLGLGSAQA